MTKFFYLKNLHSDKVSEPITIVALAIQEKDYSIVNIDFVKFTTDGQRYIVKSTHINSFLINRIEVKKGDYDKFLEFFYTFKSREKKATIRIISGTEHLISFINELLVFIKNNTKLVNEFGFRDEISSGLNNELLNYYEKVLQLKTHRLETSINRVGKDNYFYDYMVIHYPFASDYYFIKLICDFLNSTYDKKNGTITVEVSSSTAWSGSFDDRIVPDQFIYQRARIIDYISKTFNYDEWLKYHLLDLP